MNQARILGACLVAGGLVAGCAVEQPVETSTAGMSFEEFQARAGREPGTGAYIIDWDIAIHGDDALYAYWQRMQPGALTIYSVGGQDVKWSATQKKNLTYCIGAGFAGQKQTIVNAMTAATVNGWEKFADVKFIYVPGEDANCTANNQNVMFDVNRAPAGVAYLARAFFPDSGRAQRNVLVAIEALNPAQTGGITIGNILTHELGHALGFRHEHIRAPGAPCPEDNQFRSVTAYDQVSTMHYPQCGSPNNTLALSQLDRQGVAMIYGAPVVNMSPMTSITAPTNGATVPPTFEVRAAIVDTDLVSAELWIDGARYATKATGPFDFQVTNAAEGQHLLEIRGIDGAGQTAMTNILVTVMKAPAPGGGGNQEEEEEEEQGGGGDLGGGCSTGGGGAGLLAGIAIAGLALSRRRRAARA